MIAVFVLCNPSEDISVPYLQFILSQSIYQSFREGSYKIKTRSLKAGIDFGDVQTDSGLGDLCLALW